METTGYWGRRWRRLDAEHWVWVLGALETTILALITAWVLLAGLMYGFLGAIFAATIPGALTALVGWMTAAWRREERWSWVAWAVVSGTQIPYSLSLLFDPGGDWGDVAVLVAAALTVVLLVHPDSRARLSRLAPERDTVGGRRTP